MLSRSKLQEVLNNDEQKWNAKNMGHFNQKIGTAYQHMETFEETLCDDLVFECENMATCMDDLA